MKKNYVLFIDSGFGGISILNQCRKLLPLVNFLYYIDNKNCPYGNKNKDVLQKILENIIKTSQKKHKLSAVVLACNTASMCAMKYLETKFSMPIIGIEPDINNALLGSKMNEKILCMCTPLTWNNNPKINDLSPINRSKLIPFCKSELAPLIDEYIITNDNMKLKEWLKENLKNISPDKIILGCTHYVLIQGLISSVTNCTQFYSSEKQVAIELFKKIKLPIKGLGATKFLFSLKIKVSKNHLQLLCEKDRF